MNNLIHVLQSLVLLPRLIQFGIEIAPILVKNARVQEPIYWDGD